MKELEVYFDDLNEEMQKKVLDFYGIEDPKDMNWDVFPITSIFKEDEE